MRAAAQSRRTAVRLLTITRQPHLHQLQTSHAHNKMAAAEASQFSLYRVTEQLLAEVKREKEETGGLSDDLLSALHFIFRQPLLHALDLLDRGAVTHVTCPSGRELYLVKGSSGEHTCLPRVGHCSCLSFVYTVLLREEAMMCKHLLAVQLGKAMGSSITKHVTDEQLAELLSSSS